MRRHKREKFRETPEASALLHKHQRSMAEAVNVEIVAGEKNVHVCVWVRVQEITGLIFFMSHLWQIENCNFK